MSEKIDYNERLKIEENKDQKEQFISLYPHRDNKKA